ncbi:MAG TPA: hypothetical protein PK683_10565 [Leptospiraceae bacterium]|nr:hypothetical protein [Leptospiraceae bacterium]
MTQSINKISRQTVKLFLLLSLSLHAVPKSEEISKPLLRVFPVYRMEECEWAVRMDVCWSCIRKKEKYAQKIYFLKEGGTYREHGCYTEKKGFSVLSE